MTFKTINPANGAVIEEYKYQEDTEIKSILLKSEDAFLNWKKLSLDTRVSQIKSFAYLLEEKSEEVSALMTLEMGKPLLQSQKELQKCLKMIHFYLDNAHEYLKDEAVKTQFQKSYIALRPQGSILGIMPWNFPFWQVLRFAIPNLLLGNTILIKHAPNVQGSQNLLQSIFNSSNMLNGVVETLIIDVAKVEQVIANPHIRGVSFTGSEAAGRSVAEVCGRYLKKCVLELGGSDAYIVLEDADLELASTACVQSRFINSGQSCVAAKRWIVHNKVKKQFTEKVLEKSASAKLSIGPLARKDLKDKLAAQVIESIAKGAQVLMGGPEQDQDSTCFYPLTILTNVALGQDAFSEEIFGPVGVIIEANSTEHAIEIANSSSYGLGGSIFSSHLDRAEKIAKEELDTGGIFINDFYQSSMELPFGGVKNSGMGRELSKYAFYEFANIKTIVLNNS